MPSLPIITPKTLKDMSALESQLARIPDELGKFIAREFAGLGKKFATKFGEDLKGRVKVRNSKLGNAFKTFVEGDKIENLALHAFTAWKAAPVYESGGDIKATRGLMAVPINPKAFTPDGRVKAKWHDPRNFPNMFVIKAKRCLMLVRNVNVVGKAERIQNTATVRGVQPDRSAIEPMFLLIKRIHKNAMLGFYKAFEAFVATIPQTEQPKLDAMIAGVIK